ncbi:hypothetical protein Q5752_005327 [Cryptotrichosporon argae]
MKHAKQSFCPLALFGALLAANPTWGAAVLVRDAHAARDPSFAHLSVGAAHNAHGLSEDKVVTAAGADPTHADTNRAFADDGGASKRAFAHAPSAVTGVARAFAGVPGKGRPDGPTRRAFAGEPVVDARPFAHEGRAFAGVPEVTDGFDHHGRAFATASEASNLPIA